MLGFDPVLNRDNNSVGGKETHMRIALPVVAILSFSMTLVAAEPFVGTWKLNVEKSKLTGSNADLAGRTMTISQTGPHTFVSIVDSVSKSGETRHQETTRIYDGKERPATGARQQGTTEIARMVNESIRTMTGKRDGKVLGVMTSTVCIGWQGYDES
jgi:hypothetical protein